GPPRRRAVRGTGSTARRAAGWRAPQSDKGRRRELSYGGVFREAGSGVRPEPGDRPLQPFLEGDGRIVAEQAPGLLDIGERVRYVAAARLAEGRGDVGAEDAVQRVGQV